MMFSEPLCPLLEFKITFKGHYNIVLKILSYNAINLVKELICFLKNIIFCDTSLQQKQRYLGTISKIFFHVAGF